MKIKDFDKEICIYCEEKIWKVKGFENRMHFVSHISHYNLEFDEYFHKTFRNGGRLGGKLTKQNRCKKIKLTIRDALEFVPLFVLNDFKSNKWNNLEK